MHRPLELPVLQPDAPGAPQSPRRRFRDVLVPLALRLYRLGIVVAIVLIIHRHYAHLRIHGEAPVRLDEARPFFPAAAKLEDDFSERQGLFVLDKDSNRIGYVLRTSPLSDKITGYAGPTDTLVALDASWKVIGIRIRSSADTKVHVRDVGNDAYFMSTWNGKTWDQVAGMDPKSAHIEGVSGASLTSLAIANAIQQRFQTSKQAAARPAPRPHFAARDIGLAMMIAVAFLFTFTTLRSRPWLRRSFQVLLIAYVGFYNGQLLAQSLFAGWSAATIPWTLAPGLVLLAAAALAVPWTSRRAIYCSQICPHGAAQELIGRATHRIGQLPLPRGIERGLRWLPPLLIAFVLIVTILQLPIDLSNVEPFDAYLIFHTRVTWIVLAIAIAGLLAAAFVPMAYCKYACPTGLLLSFLRSHGKADTFAPRDLAAASLLLLAATLYAWYDPIHQWILRK